MVAFKDGLTPDLAVLAKVMEGVEGAGSGSAETAEALSFWSPKDFHITYSSGHRGT